MRRRTVLLSAPGMILAGTPWALHAQQHWLIGTWTGELVGSRNSETRRVLRVTAVDAAGGTATGQWGRNEPMTIRISGTTIRFLTGENLPAELSYTPPGTLEGTIQQNNPGRRSPYTITMTRR